MGALRVAALTRDLASGWSDLFEASHSGCFCRYWHFGGTKNEWLTRLASAPETNQEEARAQLLASDPQALGVVALEGELVVGWMKLAPPDAIPKLHRLPVYRSLALGADPGVYSIGCFLVRPTHRRQGVARALLEGAMSIATDLGAVALEAYPHQRADVVRDEEAWMGPASLFEQCGFRPFRGEAPYPVLRKVL
jgi:GNAT superfamily N-acetyltransferase